MVAAKLLRLRTKPKGDITVVTSIFRKKAQKSKQERKEGFILASPVTNAKIPTCHSLFLNLSFMSDDCFCHCQEIPRHGCCNW